MANSRSILKTGDYGSAVIPFSEVTSVTKESDVLLFINLKTQSQFPLRLELSHYDMELIDNLYHEIVFAMLEDTIVELPDCVNVKYE